MKYVSLKGIARNRGLSDSFSVEWDLFSGIFAETVSLRSQLEILCRKEYSFDMDECIYGWTASFLQTWTHILIRISLDPDDDVSNSAMAALKIKWREGIYEVWNNKWGCGHTGELSCPLTFEVQWTNHIPHTTVRVRLGPADTNRGTWDTTDSKRAIAHEFGHMLGLVDEYESDECPDRSPVNTGTIMDDTSYVPPRMMTRFAHNIKSRVV